MSCDRRCFNEKHKEWYSHDYCDEYSCVNVCQQVAIVVRGYDDFVPMGEKINMRSADSIMWNVTFRDGSYKKFNVIG